MCKLYDPFHVANNFIEKGIMNARKISPMKLQKLLYFLYRDYLKLTGDPLFSERFEAWKYGPVLSSIYQEFKNYRDRDIKNYYLDEEGKAFKINEGSNEAFKKILNDVWETYGNYTGIELSNLTHQPETAWHKAWINNSCFLSDEDIKNEGASTT